MKSLLVIASVCLAILLFALFKTQSDQEPRSDSAPKYNLIFITVDTLRADHTPFGDYYRPTMPSTEEFFRDGLNFTNARTVRSSTGPAYAAMLSGLYPYHTGVRNNFTELNQRIDTLAEKLQRVGYITAAFVSSFVMVGRISGFKQGFDLYDDFVLEKELNREYYERTASNTVEHAISWLKKVPKDRRFFLFLHFIDPHGPYHAPAPYNESFQSNESRMLRRDQIPNKIFISPVLDQYRYVDWYDGEILYLDSQLKNLYKQLKAFNNNSWFLFVADHGEALGEHNYFFTHGQSCYDAETRIPMVWLPPANMRKRYQSARIHNPVSLVDVLPTSLEALQVSVKPKFDGESLIPAFRGAHLKNRFRFIERYWNYDLSFVASDSHFKVIKNYREVPNREWPSKFWNPDVWQQQSVEFYDLLQDPNERKDLSTLENPPGELNQALNKFTADALSFRTSFTLKRFRIPDEEMAEYVYKHAKEQESTLTKDEVEKLKALGYVDN